MTRQSRDIFTEPEPNPDTLAALGPLRLMAGVFEGLRGADVHPAEEGREDALYLERYELQPLDAQTNGPQLFYGLRYHTYIEQSPEAGMFHDQVGYWLWEPATETVIQTLAIPRGQIAMASGHVSPDLTSFTLQAARGSTAFGICSNEFLEEAFTTLSYAITVTVHDESSWSYSE